MAGATILGCDGPVLMADEAAFFREADPWGFILFARNVENPEQLRRLTEDLRAVVGREAPVLVDQECGRVQRLRSPHWREWLPALEQVTLAGPGSMRLRARIMAAELRAVGIDVVCAPVVDIAGEDTHPFLRNRCYGEELATVVAAGRAAAEGFLQGGVLPVMKHMPGHGRGTLDSHLQLPRVSAPKSVLDANDFVAFRALADLPMAMTAHIVFDAIDPERPATQSPEVIRVIREEIGFAGLLITDDLNMQALAGTLGERTAAAMAAGCDVALQCNGKPDDMAAVVAAAGRLSPQAEARAAAALLRRGPPESVDMGALAAEFESVMAGAAHG